MPRQSFCEFIQATQQPAIREQYDRDVLNAMVTKMEQVKRDSKAQGRPIPYTITPDEYRELTVLCEFAKEHCIKIINAKFSKEWAQYSSWEKNAVAKGHLFFMASGVYATSLPPLIKVGAFNISPNTDDITVPHDFYNLLLWRRIIGDFAKCLASNDVRAAEHSAHQIPSVRKSELYTGLKRLPPFVKSASSSMVPSVPPLTK